MRAGSVRQRTAVIGPRRGRSSVVSMGVVQERWTASPMRSARRSEMGVGRLRDGGRGGPGLAQPVSRRAAKRVSAAWGVADAREGGGVAGATSWRDAAEGTGRRGVAGGTGLRGVAGCTAGVERDGWMEGEVGTTKFRLSHRGSLGLGLWVWVSGSGSLGLGRWGRAGRGVLVPGPGGRRSASLVAGRCSQGRRGCRSPRWRGRWLLVAGAGLPVEVEVAVGVAVRVFGL